MAFSLADVLSDISSLDTGAGKGREQIEYIELDALHPDPNNFYALDGIEQLAGNIELLGLQQPVRVRAVDEGYMIVSGHRRTAAIRMLVKEGREDLRQVPCIVEAAASSPELQELRLIYANSDTRTMSSAELSRQAERVEMLLYQLKEQGIEFPGRMRDHVAEACRMSKSKLARLKVIRDNLKPVGLRKAYEDGRLNETSAYEIARRSEAAQQLADEQLDYIIRRSAEEIVCIIDGLERAAESQAKIVKNVQAVHNRFASSVEDYLSQRASEDVDFFSILQVVAKQVAKRLPQMGSSRKDNIESLKRCLHNSAYGSSEVDWDAFGSKGLTLSSDVRAITTITRTWTETYDMLAAIAINELGKKLAVAVEPVPPVASVPLADTNPEWKKGLPKKDGRYLVKFDLGNGHSCDDVLEYDAYFRCFFSPGCGKELDSTVLGWWPVPMDEDELSDEELYVCAEIDD